VTDELGQLRKDEALLKKSVSSLSEAWTKCNEYVLGIRTEPESAVDCEPRSVQKWGAPRFQGTRDKATTFLTEPSAT
jgi:hypothetical protein